VPRLTMADQRRSATRLSEQRKPSSRLCVYHIHLYLLDGIQHWRRTHGLGLGRRGVSSKPPSQGSQLRRVRRLHWFNHHGAGVSKTFTPGPPESSQFGSHVSSDVVPLSSPAVKACADARLRRWPVGIDQLGPKIYFFFMAVNLVCVPVRSYSV